ncbi:MAG: NFACT family protein, partial [Candidatus Fermentibacteria bacterium]
MDGVFLSALVPLLKYLVMGMKCRKIGSPSKDGFGLMFDEGILVLNARPDSPGLSWSSDVNMTELSSGAWSHHIEGAIIQDIIQPGADRILQIHFKSGLIYGNSDVTLIFEAAGRNANVILVRSEDRRILACHRKVPSERSRYRTVAPGQVYVPPPSSGLSPGSWSSSIELKESIRNEKVSPALLYRLLEGVGPVTARALLRHAELSETPLFETVTELERALLEQDFSPWEGPDGPLPIELADGEPIENPLFMRAAEKNTSGIREDRLETWTLILRRRLSVLRKRLTGVETALDGLVSPEKYRTWGSLLLSAEDNSRKGLRKIELKDWNGSEHTIPLKPFRSLKSNATRFFRKASNTGKERRNLEEHKLSARKEIESLEISLNAASGLTVDELEASIRNYRRKVSEQDDRRKRAEAKLLSGGWRCFSGRNARENEEVTFRIGKRGDLWFHARRYPGAHVILKLDGKMDNPPA